LLYFSVLGPLHGLFSNANKRAPRALGQQLDPIKDRQPPLERKRAQGAATDSKREGRRQRGKPSKEFVKRRIINLNLEGTTATY